MGFWLDAYLGKTIALRSWRQTLPCAVVCRLSGELGMVPLTDALLMEMKRQSLVRWEINASQESALAYISISEWGDQSKDFGIVWKQGSVTFSGNSAAVLTYLREQEWIEFNPVDFDLEYYRGEDAAEKWAAAAIINRPVGVTSIKYYVRHHNDGHPASIYRICCYMDSPLFGYIWRWKEQQWEEHEDLMRRYWNGFDPDMDDASEHEVLKLIQSGDVSPRPTDHNGR